MKKYEILIIGAGPAGYEAALALSSAGKKTLLIDKSKECIGGICLNEGCIPTKAYLQSSEYISNASHFSECGVHIKIEDLNIKTLENKTTSLINEIRSGVVWMLDQACVDILFGTASFLDNNTINISDEKVKFEKCIIATGSRPRELPVLPLDGKQIISSHDIFRLDSLPKSIAIVGSGPIGCEFATFFSSLHVDVTLIGRASQLLSNEDEDISKALLRAFEKRNIRVLTSSSVKKIKRNRNNVEMFLDTKELIETELVLCASGRIPYINSLLLENTGITLNKNGFIKVNDLFETEQKNIYAIGDCINTPALAHVAATEAKIVAQNIINNEKNKNNHITPFVTFSHPCVAHCGLTEREAKEQGIEVQTKKAFFKVNAKAKILGDDSGFAKIVISSQSNIILGASIIGVEAMEVIHELMIAIEKKITYDELKNMIYVHPTVSEIIRYI